MRLISYRSGSTSGMACGPVEGPFFGEAMFYDNDGNSFFVLASQLNCSLIVSVSYYFLFDIEYNAFNIYIANTDNEIEKSNKLKIKEHEFYIGDDFDDEEDDENRDFGKEFPGYENIVNFTIKVLQKDIDSKLTEKDLDALLGEEIENLNL